MSTAPTTNDDSLDRLEPEFFTADSVTPVPTAWLWTNWIPLGKLTVIDGDPDAGKSLFLADLAARVSAGGVMPDGSQGVGGAVLLVTEETPRDAVTPRLQAAGADLSKVTILRSMRTRRKREPLLLPRDLEHLEELVLLTEAKLVILDPFLSLLKGDVAQTLRRLAFLAEDAGCAIVLARHLAKGKCREPLYRGAGPQAIVTAARAALLVARDPELPETRVLAAYKNTLAPLPAARSFTLRKNEAPPEGGTTNTAVKIIWGDESEWTAEQLLSPKAAEQEQTLFNDACRMLEQVAMVRPVPVEGIRKEARQLGISNVTLRRAKEALGLRSRRQGFGGQGEWYWYRPDDPVVHVWADSHSLEKAFQTQYRDRRPGDPHSWPQDKTKGLDPHEPGSPLKAAQMEARPGSVGDPAVRLAAEERAAAEARGDEGRPTATSATTEGGVLKDDHLCEKPAKTLQRKPRRKQPKEGWMARMAARLAGAG
jgi:putative DNA primase/helicase